MSLLLKDYRVLAAKYPGLLPCPDDIDTEQIVDNIVMAFGLFTPTDDSTLTRQIQRACLWQRVEMPADVQPMITFLQRWLPIIQET
jgi:hypothetical protein